jgi:hypothetical protein
MKWAALLMLLSVASSAWAAGSVPRDVARYIERRMMCNHWAGEEGYDAARRAQINKAVRDLRCTALARDERVLRQRHRHNPTALRQIKAAREAYPD